MRVMLLIVALGLALCAPVGAQELRPLPGPLPAAGDESTDNEMPATEGDGAVLATLLAVHDHAIATAEVARRKNASQPVADYAKFLFDEHTRERERTAEVMSAIRAQNEDTAQLKAMRAAKETERERLADLDGDEFEAAWLQSVANDNTEALAIIDSRLLRLASNDDVQVHLRTLRAHLSTRLERANQLMAFPAR